LPLTTPFADFYTATVRAGSAASNELELLGTRVGESQVMAYARIRIE